MNTKYAYTLEEKTEVTVVKVAKEKHYVRLGGCGYGNADNFVILTEEQFKVLEYLTDNNYFDDWEEIDPTELFDEI